MKVKDFFKAVHGAEPLCKDFPERDVEVRLYNSDGVRITSNIELDVLYVTFGFPVCWLIWELMLKAPQAFLDIKKL